MFCANQSVKEEVEPIVRESNLKVHAHSEQAGEAHSESGCQGEGEGAGVVGESALVAGVPVDEGRPLVLEAVMLAEPRDELPVGPALSCR